ncbi:MAG: diaminopimelate epimerase [Chlamydiae bacterium]|nr:diaminopimelate epimerase [Chlamydiota bacterium]MBI3278161.1 diaminopimelate epimerase [Chlamydiota bacterium]
MKDHFNITHFYKYHALGNDYIVIDPNKAKIELTPERIQLICHRNFGVGSDGILYGPVLKGKEIHLRIFNPDGSEAEKSGNGIRIFSKYLFEEGYVTSKKFGLETLGGKVEAEILDDEAKSIKVNMGKVTFESECIPVSGKARMVIRESLALGDKSYEVTCLSIGNPHCVIPLKSISKKLAMELGPQVENHSIFPKRINMQLLQVLDRENIQIEIWERGAGYTLASGSSSCAAASAAYKLGLVDSSIKVHMPGGVIGVDISSSGHVFMTGAVSSVGEGMFSKEFCEKIGIIKNL